MILIKSNSKKNLMLSSQGPPIAGWLVDYTGNKENAFYLSAALLFTSALVCVFAWLAQKAKERRGNRA